MQSRSFWILYHLRGLCHLQLTHSIDTMMPPSMPYFIVLKSVYMSNFTATLISKTFEGFSRPATIPKRWTWLRFLWSPITVCSLLEATSRVCLLDHATPLSASAEAEEG